jgi:hypothetical protein
MRRKPLQEASPPKAELPAEPRDGPSAPRACWIGDAGGRIDPEEASAGGVPAEGGAVSEARDGASGPPAGIAGTPGRGASCD